RRKPRRLFDSGPGPRPPGKPARTRLEGGDRRVRIRSDRAAGTAHYPARRAKSAETRGGRVEKEFGKPRDITDARIHIHVPSSGSTGEICMCNDDGSRNARAF